MAVRRIDGGADCYARSNHTRWEAHVYPLRVDAWVCLAGLCAGLFSIVYVRIHRRTEPEDDSAEAVGTLLVWSFCALHHSALVRSPLHCSSTFCGTMTSYAPLLKQAALVPLESPPSAGGLGLRVLAHVGGLGVACGVAGRPPWTLAAAALPALTLAYAAAAACTQTGVGVVTTQAMLDALLLMGHRWDQTPELQAVLNCWIFYIAGSGAVLAGGMLAGGA